MFFRHIEDHLSQEAFKTEQLSQDIEAIKNGDDTKGAAILFIIIMRNSAQCLLFFWYESGSLNHNET